MNRQWTRWALALSVSAAITGLTQAAPDCSDANSNGQLGTNGFVGTVGFGKISGGTVFGSGATLFVDFFLNEPSTNDWLDCDGDGLAGGAGFQGDQLATLYSPPSPLPDTHLIFTYRSVGSVNGFNEFVDSQICGGVPTDAAALSEAGIFNRFVYAIGGSPINGGQPFANSSGIPLEPCQVDLSVLDVPSFFAVRKAGAGSTWDANPPDGGYGFNPISSTTDFESAFEFLERDCNGDMMVTPDEQLNQNLDNPDGDTVFDTPIAWGPVAFIANRGTDVEFACESELQYHFVTGRFPNGENLQAATRDFGSGTRNAAMTSLGVDPVWGRGDNIGNRNGTSSSDTLGPNGQWTNNGGSSRMEGRVESRRLAIGYTGACGGSRAIVDADDGDYEIVSISRDTKGCDACNETTYRRPRVNNILDNCDACTAYTVGGNVSLSHRGNPNANRDAGDPLFRSGPPMENGAAAQYINNINSSISDFVDQSGAGGTCRSTRVCSGGGLTPCDPGDVNACFDNGSCIGAFLSCDENADCESVVDGDICRQNVLTPGFFLATRFFLPAGQDCQQNLADPDDFSSPTTGFSQNLQDFLRSSGACDASPYGSANVAGKTPRRATASYSDGQNGAYCVWSGSSFGNLTGGSTLNLRNQVAGDFNGDFARTIADAAELVEAYAAPRAWQSASGSPANPSMGGNAVPEILGDFNADGNFTKEDLRYWADGLAMVSLGESNCCYDTRLDRKAGAIAVDTALAANAVPYPWADTRGSLVIPPASACGETTYATPQDVNSTGASFLATGAAYKNGDFRGDVADAEAIASRGTSDPYLDSFLPFGTNPGGLPMGWDGRVDDTDIDYVCRNIGDWANLDEAVLIDLSSDMNGDLAVSYDDVVELVEVILATTLGDANLDGAVDAADEAIVNDSIANGCNGSCGWADGDFNCDAVVNTNDLAVISGGGSCPKPGAGGACPQCDLNESGLTEGLDIAIITSSANFGLAVGVAAEPCADVNGSGIVEGLDVAACTSSACFGL